MARLPSSVLSSFMNRAALAGINTEGLALLDAPTEDIIAAFKTGNARDRDIVTKHARNFAPRRMPVRGAPRQNGGSRLEENYFYSSRRFPSAVNNTIGAGALTAGSFPLFSRGIGEDGSGLGFPTGFVLAQAETNLDVGGYLPQGSSFVGSQIGISVNSDCTTPDLAVFMDVAALNFSKAGGQFAMLQGPIKAWPSGMGIGGYASAATTVAATTVNVQAPHNGSADIRAVRNLKIPRILREKEVFNYSIFISRATKATNGTTIALLDFLVATIWLFGGQKNVIPS
ncbi:MAG: hypothetical protein ABIR60_08705 [Allosphingosinicella sp.]